MFSKEVVPEDWLHTFPRKALGYNCTSEADPHLGRGPSVLICTSIGHVVDRRGGGQGTRGLWDKVILEGEGT